MTGHVLAPELGREWDVPISQAEAAGLRTMRTVLQAELRITDTLDGRCMLRAGDRDRWALQQLYRWRRA